tara:strand:- start:6451 stop:6750 length:300 start_codon:yes stop_codon:yes gene_type:complete
MADQHPLTDKIIREELITRDECDRRLGDGRANYYEEDFRTAADWQLEECDDELGNILHCLALAGKITEEERIQIFVLFKEAMRPTNATNTGEQLNENER